jgi:hypothetical protein
MAETLRVDLYDLSVALTDPLLGDKESGGGITLDSDWEREYDEMVEKVYIAL